jgi:DNA-binding winged helix-turn-helix (wHTH) protein
MWRKTTTSQMSSAGCANSVSTPIGLHDQSFQILVMLVERRGELVTRDEIRYRLWPGDTFVDFDHGLNNAVNRLREALGDSADTRRLIETLPRRGYKFIGVINQAEAPRRREPTQKDASAKLANLRPKGDLGRLQSWHLRL